MGLYRDGWMGARSCVGETLCHEPREDEGGGGCERGSAVRRSGWVGFAIDTSGGRSLESAAVSGIV